MRFSLTSLIRLLVALMLGSTAAAIGVSRLAGPAEARRVPRAPEYVGLNAFVLTPGFPGSYWLERDRGRIISPDLAGGDALDYASLSPWRDDRGRAQAVGRWSGPLRVDSGAQESGLIRATFPDGEVLDRVATDLLPIGAPCWYPGTTARVLFAAGDGALYRFAFESGPDAGPGRGERDERPRRIGWRVETPGRRPVYIADPHWPSDARFGRLLFVALREIEPGGGRPRMTRTRLWWLRLDDDGGAIEGAGRLIPPGAGPEAGDVEERFPTVGIGPDGRPILGYLRKVGDAPWELHAVPIAADPAGRRPPVVVGPGTKLADCCLPSAPALSTDGRWISAVTSDASRGAVLVRVDLATRAATRAMPGPPTPR